MGRLGSMVSGRNPSDDPLPKFRNPLEMSPELGRQPVHSEFPECAFFLRFKGFGNQRIQFPLF